MKTLLLATCLICAASASAQADSITYTEVGDTGGTTWCGGFCDYVSPSELASVQYVTDPFTTQIVGTYNNESTGDIFGFYWPFLNGFTLQAAGPFNSNGQVAVSMVLLDASATRISGSNTTQLGNGGSLPAANYFVYFEAPGSGGSYSLTFNHFVDPPPAAVPTPPTLPLFATGLGLMAFLGWRRTRLRLQRTDRRRA